LNFLEVWEASFHVECWRLAIVRDKYMCILPAAFFGDAPNQSYISYRGCHSIIIVAASYY